MRQRGYLGADLAAALTQEGLYVDGSDKKININKEKMSAEYKDCYLYMTYYRMAFDEYRTKFSTEYETAVEAAKANLDVRCILTLFASRLPLCLDFVSHLHYRNTEVMRYMIARMAVALDTEGRSGYRRVLMHFIHDMDGLPASLSNLMFKNANSMCAVDIELMHGKFASIIPAVHHRSSEQEVINNTCRS